MELNVGQRLALAIDMHLILDAGAGTGKSPWDVKTFPLPEGGTEQ